MIVAPAHHKIFTSILNDFGEGRIKFTYEEFIQAAESLGFKWGSKRALIPPRRIGRGLFHCLKDNTRGNHDVSPETQDQWKVKLYQLYGWTEDTFRSRLT